MTLFTPCEKIRSMATMFKKNTKRNFRKKIVEDERDDEEENNPAVIKGAIEESKPKEKVKPKNKIDKVASSNSLLSFGDEEIAEDSEVFKVRKTKESRRLAKKIEQEKKRKVKVDEAVILKNNHGEYAAKEENADEKLAALRAELSQMAGEDLDEEDDADSVGSGSVKKEPSISFTLGSGSSDFSIPDAATIHAARKRREQARQTGEFIPLDDTQKYEGHSNTSTGRLVREDENDASDDDEEDGPIKFTGARKGGFPALDRRREVEVALSNQELEDKSEEDEEEDEGLKLWEDEQIRKGVSAPMAQAEPQQTADMTNSAVFQQLTISDGQLQLFPSQVSQLPYTYGTTYSSMHANGNQSYGTAMTALLPQTQHAVTVDMICDKMNQQLGTLQEVHRGHRMDKDRVSSQLDSAQASIKKLERQGRNAEQRFGFFQEMRGYVRDLIECLNNKVPQIDELEHSKHDLLRSRASSLVQRRQMDVSDQAGDFINAQSGRKAQSNPQSTDQSKSRRVAEREGRRARRRKHREKEKKAETHREGQSTDDEETETDAVKFRAETKRISTEEKTVFEDVIEDFSSIDSIKSRFEDWKNNYEDCYRNAYISLCLPKLFAPFVRLQLLDWNPFEAKCLEIEDFRWYKSLVLFGCGDDPYDIDVEDPDVKLIPTVLEKSLIPKLTGFFEHVWDPLSHKQTVWAIKLMRGMSEVYPNFHAQNKATQSLFAAIVTRMRRCVSDDVYVPLYPRSLLENKSVGALAFFQRQFWSCVKLLGNILRWEGLVSSARLQEMAIDGLLNRYLILTLQHSHLYYDSLEKAKAITASFPKQWFIKQQQTTLPSLEAFARYLASLAASMQRSCAGCPETEKKKARSGIKKVIQLLLQFRAVDKAKLVAAEHNMEDLVKDV